MDDQRCKQKQMKKKFLFWSFLFILLTTYNYKGTKNFISELFIIKEIEIEGENFLINQGWIPNDLKSETFDLKKTKYFGITKQ